MKRRSLRIAAVMDAVSLPTLGVQRPLAPLVLGRAAPSLLGRSFAASEKFLQQLEIIIVVDLCLDVLQHSQRLPLHFLQQLRFLVLQTERISIPMPTHSQ